MVVITLIASRKSVMGEFTSSRYIIILGWIGTAIMGLAAALMLVPDR
jgi:Mn2+/Fe2+ NRAMP family transporter